MGGGEGGGGAPWWVITFMSIIVSLHNSAHGEVNFEEDQHQTGRGACIRVLSSLFVLNPKWDSFRSGTCNRVLMALNRYWSDRAMLNIINLWEVLDNDMVVVKSAYNDAGVELESPRKTVIR